MIAVLLHARFWNLPNRTEPIAAIETELVPARIGQLGQPHAGQHQQLPELLLRLGHVPGGAPERLDLPRLRESAIAAGDGAPELLSLFDMRQRRDRDAIIAAADRIVEHPLRFNVDGARHRQRRAGRGGWGAGAFCGRRNRPALDRTDFGDLVGQGGDVARDQIDDGPIAEHRQQDIVEYLPHHIGGAMLPAMMCVRR